MSKQRRFTKEFEAEADGHGWVVDLDLEKFFDHVNHDRLMGQIAQRIGDRRLLKLIRAFLTAGGWRSSWQNRTSVMALNYWGKLHSFGNKSGSNQTAITAIHCSVN